MIDSEYKAPADGDLHAAHRGRLVHHQGRQPLPANDPSTLLGACPPREHRHLESII
jgi:hypothetical protein